MSEAAQAPLVSLPANGHLHRWAKWTLDPRQLYVGPIIGEGTYGRVHRGRFRGEEVAIKVMRRPQTSDEEQDFERTFRREVTILAGIQHPNIVKFIGACDLPRVVVTEYLGGGSLRAYLGNGDAGPLPLDEIVRLALELARAMECLHAHSLMHRDLKSDNLMFSENRKVLKLVDFGLAREETISIMTADAGSYRWMAPELYGCKPSLHETRKRYTHKVDVYSFAIVLWELIARRLPFTDMDAIHAAQAASMGKRPKVPRGCPAALRSLMEACWSGDSNQRPEFSEIVTWLKAFQDSLVVQDRPGI